MGNLRWLIIENDANETPMFAYQSCVPRSFCGMLIGDSSSMKSVFDHNGWHRSYFKVLDPFMNMEYGYWHGPMS